MKKYSIACIVIVFVALPFAYAQEKGGERLQRIWELRNKPQSESEKAIAEAEAYFKAKQEYAVGKFRPEAKIVVKEYARKETSTLRCANTQGECGTVARLYNEVVWSESTGGKVVSEEILTPRYGGTTCSLTTLYDPESWPPQSGPTGVIDTCAGDGTQTKLYTKDDDAYQINYLESMRFLIPHLGNGSGTAVRQVNEAFAARDIVFDENTSVSLDIQGNRIDSYDITLAAVASEIYDAPLFTARYRQLGRSEYTVAGQSVDRNGEFSVRVRGGDRIDVTPRAKNARFYVFEVIIKDIKKVSEAITPPVVSTPPAPSTDNLGVNNESIFDTISLDLKVNGKDGSVRIAPGSRIVVSWISEGATRCRANWSRNDIKLAGTAAGRLSRSVTIRAACINAEGERVDDAVQVLVDTESS